MRVSIWASALALCVTASALAAPIVPAPRPNDRLLERRVDQLERSVRMQGDSVYDLARRIEDLERRLSNPLPPPSPIEFVSVCMIVDSGYTKTFVGVGKNRIDAEIEVRKSCESNVHSSYCSRPENLKCDDTRSTPAGQGYVCMLTDSGYGKVFRGEGRTAIEGEANAKIACQQQVHTSYCGNVTPRCEVSYR